MNPCPQSAEPLPADLTVPLQSSPVELIFQNICFWCRRPIPAHEMGLWCSSTCKSQDDYAQKLNGGW
jgi:hypothetical protein